MCERPVRDRVTTTTLTSRGRTGCNSRLSSIASSGTSRLSTQTPLVLAATAVSTLEVTVEPRANGRPICSGAAASAAGLRSAARRGASSSCRCGRSPCFSCTRCGGSIARSCGVKVERVPWADGKSQLTTSYRWFLAGWAQAAVVAAGGRRRSTPPGSTSTLGGVRRGLGPGPSRLVGIEAIGVDEIQWRRGHHYLTLVYQIDAGCRRLLWIGRERTEQSLRGFFRTAGRRGQGGDCGSCAATCGSRT